MNEIPNFSEIFGTDSNVKGYFAPELPMITFKKDKIEYSIVDMRYLNKNAVSVFVRVVNNIIEDETTNEVAIELHKDIPQAEIRIIVDILLGLQWTMKKKGKNGFYAGGSFLILGIEQYDYKLIVECNKDHAKYIRNYYKGQAINYYEMVADVLYKDHCADSENFKRVAEQYG